MILQGIACVMKFHAHDFFGTKNFFGGNIGISGYGASIHETWEHALLPYLEGRDYFCDEIHAEVTFR